MELGSDGVCDDVLGGVYSIFNANWSVVAQSQHLLGFRNVHLGGFTSIRGRNVRPTKCLHREGENGGGPCLACPIIQTVIFWPVKAKTISMPTSRNSLHLGRWESSSYLQTRSCGCE